MIFVKDPARPGISYSVSLEEFLGLDLILPKTGAKREWGEIQPSKLAAATTATTGSRSASGGNRAAPSRSARGAGSGGGS